MKLSAETLRNLVELAPDAMLVVDADGHIVYANRQAVTLFNCDIEDLIGSSVEDLMPERYRARHHVHRDRFAADGHLRPMGLGLDLYGLRRDGIEFPVEISLSPLDRERALTAVAIRDVSDRKQVERELMAARELADRANQAKSRFLAMASHDLRQPLQALSLLNGTLRRMDLPPKAAAALLQQERSIEAMKRLLHALLDISKLESGSIKPENVDVDLGTLCAAVATELEATAMQKGLVLQLDVGPTFGRTDPALLEQILRNLVSNAIKYTQQGSIALRCHERNGQPCIEVSDTGVGIPPDQIPLIFEEFFQVGVAPNVTRDGYGLGLSIVQRLVKLLNLKLEVQSQVGRGSTFVLYVPAGSRDQAIARSNANRAAASAPRSLQPATVLLVEDDPAVLAATGLLLEMEEYRVIAAATKAEALQRAREHRDIELIVTDFHLDAGETGLEVLEAVRAELGRSVPVIVTTGDTSKAIQGLPRDERLRVASKPIDAEELLGVVRELIART